MLAILCTGSKEDETPADFLDTVPSLPPRFSYSKLQKATKNFSRKLGDGAFGSVYEGTLANGARVAVKMLEKTSVQGEKQFRAEVASMGAIRHLNLVRLHGFCSEGTHRLLVYEYMPNGSVDAWLFGKKQGEKLLDWEQRLNIALGTARALAYLHEECSDHIIHLDVKPENILLDHQFCPKVWTLILSPGLMRCLALLTAGIDRCLWGSTYVSKSPVVVGRLRWRSICQGFRAGFKCVGFKCSLDVSSWQGVGFGFASFYQILMCFRCVDSSQILVSPS